MKKTIVWVFIVSAIYLTGCSSDMYSSAREYPHNRYQQYDPFMSNPGFYGRQQFGFGPFDPYSRHQYGFSPYGSYGYSPYSGYGQSYRGYDRRRPRVIVRSAPQQGSGVRIRPINPRTDRYNPRDSKKD